MITPVSPQFVYVIHKDKERELEQKIVQARIARERAASGQVAAETAGVWGWYAQASQWLKARLASRAPEVKLASQPDAFKEPCQCLPC